MIRHLLAPHVRAAADVLHLPQTVDGAQGVVLTFDDGPHPQGTPAVLEILARAGAHAMFFLVGEQVERRPQLAREIAAAGHQLALHGYRHRLQLRLTASELQADFARGLNAIANASGEEPIFHRPPYGVYSAAGLAIARQHELRPLLWSRWGKDWRKFTSPQRIATRAAGNARAGDVILLHDADFYSAKGSHRRTAQALRPILDSLGERELDTVLPG